MSHVLGFLGAGNMAEAIVRAAIDKHVLPAGSIIAFDPAPARCDLFRGLGVSIASDNAQVIHASQQVLLAVKPQMFPQVAGELAAHLAPGHVVISIMAGLTTTKIASAMGKPVRIVRVMPNTPLLLGLGMSGVCLGKDAKPGDEALTLQLFGAAGKVVTVEEEHLDAITAVSGSGPAYVYYLAEAMERAASELGLGSQARALVAQTILGAAKMLADSPDSAAELRRKVTSPGGTTQAALEHMEKHQVAATITDALHAAHRRSVELGK